MVNGHPPSKEKKGVRNFFKKLFSRSPSEAPTRSSSPLPPISSRENPTRERASSGSLPPATSPAAQDQHDFSTQQGPTIVISSGQPLEPTSGAAEKLIDSRSPPPKAESTTKDSLKVAGRFIQMLMTKLPEIVDGNPAKMALGLAKVIIEIKKGVEDNMDTVERRIASMGAQLDTVGKALDGWRANSEEERRCIDRFTTTLEEEMAKLSRLSEGWMIRKVADYEDEKSRITEIFECVNEARIQFELAIGIRVFKSAYTIEEGLRGSLLDRLKASHIADHNYHLEGTKELLLHRVVCTHGTRVRILDDIITWAKDASSNSPHIYWLFGPAGSGKSTIAYTIARRFEFAGDTDDKIILGGNFFCSRQFDETKHSKWIVRTIAYHLALRCKPFADALLRSEKFDTIHHNVRAQIQDLLVKPWQASESARFADSSTTPPQYLIVIDALDEIDGTGGSEFLHDLLDVINENGLKGLKFFATSRPDPDLVTRVGSFANKQLYRLEEVPLGEAEADIRTYLNTGLPRVGREVIEKLVAAAAGLFIYAATVVKYLGKHIPQEQKKLLKNLLSFSNSTTPQTLRGLTAPLDELYTQVLLHAFGSFEGDILLHRKHILFTFLCTSERTSTSIVTSLLPTDDSDSDCASVAETNPAVGETSIADDVLQRLHAVLYIENNKVLWHHKSFPDFLFDQNRSKDYWCNEAEHHRLLTYSCFRIMEEGLRFNIANIPSSFILDRDNTALPGEVGRGIPPILSYSCRNWDNHLSFTTSAPADPLHGIMSEFLQLRILFWIEAMNLIGSCGLCDPMLRTACKWVTNADSALAKQYAEAANFAVYFSGSAAVLSTPHLYVSALATWPRNTEPCGEWRNRFPGVPAFANASRGGTSLITLRVKSEVNAVAFSSDGRRIVSGSRDNSVRVWDASTGEELNLLKGHTHSVNSVAFSSDGRRIVSGSWDNSVRVWDASMGEELNLLKGHTDSVNAVAFSSDGRWIVSGSSEKSMREWNMGHIYIREKTEDSGGDERHTGWLISPDRSAYLMFVPPDALLPDPSNILTIPRSAASSVNFSNATLGPWWYECYCL